MLVQTHSEFLRSWGYRCALVAEKRDQQRLDNIRDILDRVDDAQKRRVGNTGRNSKGKGRIVVPDFDPTKLPQRLSHEDKTIMAADTDKQDWVYNDQTKDYELKLGGVRAAVLPKDVYEYLKPFQRDAVKWISGAIPVGALLGDDMGLGKTIMSIASIGSQMRLKKCTMALCVAPVSVMNDWVKAGTKFLSKFVKDVQVVMVHGGNKKERNKTIRNAWKKAKPDRPCLIVSSWGLVTSANNESFKTFLPPSGRFWDLVILDEAHQIRNHKSNQRKLCSRLCHKPGTKRLLLTGTPFQNNTDELWSIIHMATAGNVLGKLKEFNQKYGKPIKDARCKNAYGSTIKRGEQANKELQEILKPIILRRKKVDFLKDELPPKEDICVWVKPSKQQMAMYKAKVDSMSSVTKSILGDDKAQARSARMSAFNALAELKNLCSHPIRLRKGGPAGDIKSALEQTDTASILNGSLKLKMLIHMLAGFTKEGEKALVFSKSTQSLDIIQHVLRKQTAYQFGRIDGSTSEKKRRDIVEVFQARKLDLLLISTGAGGTGLTLHAATRVIIYDPSWNPSDDAQAVDRAYRIGQTRRVIVYRLMIGGSIEEKIYERQIHKTGLEKTIFEIGKPEERFFDKHELCKVFTLVPDGSRCDILKRFDQENVAKVSQPERHKVVGPRSAMIGLSNHLTVYAKKRSSVFSEGGNAKVSKKARIDNETEKDQASVDDSAVADDEIAEVGAEKADLMVNDSNGGAEASPHQAIATPDCDDGFVLVDKPAEEQFTLVDKPAEQHFVLVERNNQVASINSEVAELENRVTVPKAFVSDTEMEIDTSTSENLNAVEL